MAFALRSLLKIVDNHKLIPTKITISIPEFCSFDYMKAILNAARISGIPEKDITFLDECSASIGELN